MNNIIEYPTVEDTNLQYKLYKKRELYSHKTKEKPELNTYNEIKNYRDEICKKHMPHQHQNLIANIINPDTPYKGLLCFHGTGTGKCVHPNTLINNLNMTIEQIWENYKTTTGNKNNEEWTTPSTPVIVNSFYDNKIITTIVKRLYREFISNFMEIITLENNLSIQKTTIHKLLSNNGWTNKLKVGDEICYTDNNNTIKMCKIKYIKIVEYKGYVYDLEVDYHHNFVANNIICHNTCLALTTALKFIQQVRKYNTRIYILVPGGLQKKNWRDEMIKCYGDKIYNSSNDYLLTKEQIERNKTEALNTVLQDFRIMGFKSFTKKVLGTRVIDTIIKDNKVTKNVRKTDEGEDEYDIPIDKIYNLNNTLLIVDEAHNITDNTTGQALQDVIKNSVNLKILLLTATPMKNLADQIIELINFLRPPEYPMIRENIFSGEISRMTLKENGIEYFTKMIKGYVSHIRGADPMLYALRNERGKIPNGLLFTKVTTCIMDKFQLDTYNKSIHEIDDALERSSEAISNFVFPGLSENNKTIVGYHNVEGLNTVINQLKSNSNELNKKLMEFLNIKKELNDDLIGLTQNKKSINGMIFDRLYLKTFSCKFYKILMKLDKLYYGKKGNKTIFIYSNLVQVGIDLLETLLLYNGYLEFQDSQNYNISPSTICYFCGLSYSSHKNKEKLKDIPEHIFAPSTFIKITGKQSEEEELPEEKINTLNEYFNKTGNRNGKYIKVILGSRVMNEGISLKNVGEIHIVDVYYNLNRLDQVIGRGIRWCSHYDIMSEETPFPKVDIYKYCITLKPASNELSSEEILYQKAERKYLLIKRLERVMKENSIDCPLNYNNNVFKKEVKENEKCQPIKIDTKEKENLCPSICDYEKCDFKCNDDLLNNKYYDPDRVLYKNLSKNELDYSTFTKGFARVEIDNAKKIVKELYLKGFVYELTDILSYVKKRYIDEKNDLFDEFFVFKALDELVPITENDFNNYGDKLVDKFGKLGYLIYVNKYYIFQSFSLISEIVPMYYRTTFKETFSQHASLYNYIKHTYLKTVPTTQKQIKTAELIGKSEYEFDMDYYNNRDEYVYIGIIDKDEKEEVFRIRKKRDKILEKKRGTGIPTLKGAVCSIAKHKSFLLKLIKETKLKVETNKSKIDICSNIKEQLLKMEKYATGKNKMTYIMIPKNHPIYPFPYNLEDRVEYIIKTIKDKTTSKIKITTEKEKNKIKLVIDKNDGKDNNKILLSLGFKLGKNYEMIVD